MANSPCLKKVGSMADSVNKKYKDGIFTDLFSSKEDAISLFNAISGENYSIDTPVSINTLNGVIYNVVKNDISFTIDNLYLALYEHQSTVNENMPLRMLIYIARVYEELLDERAAFREKVINIPTPQLVVFYNGYKQQPKERILKLSDAFLIKEEHPSVELEVRMININPAANHEILQKCQRLLQYGILIDKIREFQEKNVLKVAIDEAIRYCIKHNILKSYLLQKGLEVTSMLYTEYNEEIAMQIKVEEARNEAIEEERKNIALNLIRNNLMSDKDIASVTKLSIEEIQQLRNK